jgi:hypothetical protein
MAFTISFRDVCGIDSEIVFLAVNERCAVEDGKDYARRLSEAVGQPVKFQVSDYLLATLRDQQPAGPPLTSRILFDSEAETPTIIEEQKCQSENCSLKPERLAATEPSTDIAPDAIQPTLASSPSSNSDYYD